MFERCDTEERGKLMIQLRQISEIVDNDSRTIR